MELARGTTPQVGPNPDGEIAARPTEVPLSGSEKSAIGEQVAQTLKILDDLNLGQEALEQDTSVVTATASGEHAGANEEMPPNKPRGARIIRAMETEYWEMRKWAETTESPHNVPTARGIVVGRNHVMYFLPNRTNCVTEQLILFYQTLTDSELKQMKSKPWVSFVQTFVGSGHDTEIIKEGSVWRQGAVKAMKDHGVGDPVPSLSDIQQYDLIQAWPRTSGPSGDLMMVYKVDRDVKGNITRFWCFSAGNWSKTAASAYMFNSYTPTSFNAAFKEYYIGRYRETISRGVKD
jgi:hypothetical protein